MANCGSSSPWCHHPAPLGYAFAAEDHFGWVVNLFIHPYNQLVAVSIKCKQNPMIPLVGALPEKQLSFELIDAISGINKQGTESCVCLIALEDGWD